MCPPESSHSKLHLFTFWPPEGLLELRQVTTVTAHNTQNFFPEGSFPEEGEHCPDKAYTCSWTVQQQRRHSEPTGTARSRTQTLCLPPQHMPHTENPELALIGGEYTEQKCISVPLCKEEFGALHCLKLHKFTSSVGSDITWGKPRDRWSCLTLAHESPCGLEELTTKQKALEDIFST